MLLDKNCWGLASIEIQGSLRGGKINLAERSEFSDTEDEFLGVGGGWPNLLGKGE